MSNKPHWKVCLLATAALYSTLHSFFISFFSLLYLCEREGRASVYMLSTARPNRTLKEGLVLSPSTRPGKSSSSSEGVREVLVSNRTTLNRIVSTTLRLARSYSLILCHRLHPTNPFLILYASIAPQIDYTFSLPFLDHTEELYPLVSRFPHTHVSIVPPLRGS